MICGGASWPEQTGAHFLPDFSLAYGWYKKFYICFKLCVESPFYFADRRKPPEITCFQSATADAEVGTRGVEGREVLD